MLLHIFSHLYRRHELVFGAIVALLYACFLSGCIRLSIYGSSYGKTDDLEHLKLLHVISRHGARNPRHFYPTDPNRYHEFVGGNGALTNLGKLQSYKLGKFLKERYSGFLSSNPKEVFARSSSSERAMESALSALAGLYPPVYDQIWNKDLLWQPIPVYSIPQKEDYLLYYNATCPVFFKELHRYWNTEAVLEYFRSRKDFLQLLIEKTGMQIQYIYQVLFIHSTLEIEKQHGLPLPYWATEEVLEKMREMAVMAFRLVYGTTKLQKLKGGPLVKDILNNVQKKLEGSLGEKKLFWYSTHDAIVVAFMRALEIFNEELPPFAATIIVEFHSSGTKDFLRFFYANSTTPENGPQELHQLRLPGCSYECPLNIFRDLTANMIPLDPKKECFQE